MSNDTKTDIVPWKNPAEFIKVYECAYSDKLNENCWAVEKISVWETRCWPSLPTAVESTLLFVRCKIQDQLCLLKKTFCNTQDIEMMYSNAVVRFVNLLLENDQNTKAKKKMSYLAEERNIPPWIIEIRHNCTHGFHPTLPVLRMAYETIMAYLRNTFWLPEKSRVCAITKTYDDTPMVELLQNYREKQYQVLTDKLLNADNVRTGARDKTLRKIDFILSKTEPRKNFLKVLVHDFVTLDDVDRVLSDDQIFMDEQMLPNNISLPEPLQEFYYPLIKLLHKHDLISTFLELLLLSQEKRDLVILQKIVDYAVIFILDLARASSNISRQLTMPFICKGANINLYRMLYSCVMGCSTTVRVVFERLVSDLQMQDWIQELTSMMNIKQGNSIPNEYRIEENRKQKRKFDITFTVEDMEEDLFEVREYRNPKKRECWSLAPFSIDWASTPIGHVFNPTDLSKDDESKHEGETSAEENNESLFGYQIEESKPITTPPLAHFIFSECPTSSSMLYTRNHSEINAEIKN